MLTLLLLLSNVKPTRGGPLRLRPPGVWFEKFFCFEPELIIQGKLVVRRPFLLTSWSPVIYRRNCNSIP